jgi:alkylation response protein AidB-like acyl-CoA dehydrogenase
MFAEAIQKILDNACTPAVVRKVEAGASPVPLWEALSGGGFLELLAPEDEGGAGLQLPELFPIFRHFGSYAVPVPIAQTIAASFAVGSLCPRG